MKSVLLLANGPGELWGWVRPVAAELKRRSRNVTLLLLPCQFASGEERRVAENLAPDELRGPSGLAGTLRDALVLGRTAEAVLQLGGDPAWGRIAAWAGRAPLLCYAYGRKNGLSSFDRVFTAYPPMAELMGEGVQVVGDLVRDSLALDGQDFSGDDAAPAVLFFPGSRAAIREFSFPFLREMLPFLKNRAPGWRFSVVLSPFSTQGEEEAWRSAGFYSARGAEAFRGAEFAVTQPGTNTLELMYRRIPFCVLVPFTSLRKIPLPGLPGLFASLPGIGPSLRETVLRRRRKKMELLAWPNRLAGRMLAEEFIGDYSPETAAEFVISWLRDRSRRDGLRDALGEVAASAPPGAAAAVADEIERMAVRE
ncbi:cdisaccharide synthetase [Aminivibrio sp.]|jgi:lipid-A-disaccharide synthase|uniref:cdisaccharide synthetase n=1 Tax=Aminivibrio sp. TaxID=1872489 RepID=UPI001A398EE7|nr:cdisaccharide synthetase [Aminivibrio sp.]MBL3540410.1 cdisaccharide synthetase [Aminivibrio sp.]MDK2959342.1 hypothetical protein [Synergistaceae bacterium]